MKYLLSNPTMTMKMTESVVNALQNEPPFNGEQTKKFEEEFAQLCNRKHAISCSSGHIALIMALQATKSGTKPRRVQFPMMTFIATATAPLWTRDMLLYADVKIDTYNINPLAIFEDADIIIPVHLHGRVCEMENLPTDKIIIEDCAQAHGATRFGKVAGSFGDIGCFSFYPSKNMTVYGDGGMCVTDDDDLAAKLDGFRWHFSTRENKYYHVGLGISARMSNIHAAIGRQQLKKLKMWNFIRTANARTYTNELKNVDGLRIPPFEDGHVWHQYAITTEKRDKLAAFLGVNGIETGVHYPIPIHRQDRMFGYVGPEAVADYLARTMLSLPVHHGLRPDNVREICEKIKEFFGNESSSVRIYG